MLYVSLIPSVLLLIAAHVAARPYPKPFWSGWFVPWCFGALVLSLCVAASPVVLTLAVLLTLGLVAWSVTRRRLRTFLPYSLSALVIAYGLAAWPAWERYERAVALRPRYPFEPLADRVPEPRRGAAPPTREAWDRLVRFEHDNQFARPVRDFSLEAIHDRTVNEFVNSPGFGVARIIPTNHERTLERRGERELPPPQPESPGPAWGLGDVQFTLPEHDRTAAYQLHADGLLDFVHAEGWGHMRSRREVAGFLPHAFSRVPEGREWRAVRVELVGLLKHPEPAVYPSDRLPAMADLKDTPTRAPDAFEAAGVAAIRKGEAGFVGRRGDEVRYVGAVRSAAACVECHGGERGDLLGAFSYRLRLAGR